MGTTESSETLSVADYFRSARTTTQADADALAAEHDVDDVTAAVRWSGVSH